MHFSSYKSPKAEINFRVGESDKSWGRAIVKYVIHQIWFWRQYRSFRSKMPGEILNFLRKPEKAQVVVDVGANIGVATKLFRSFGLEVIAYEPHPQAFELLRRRFHNDSKVQVNQSAVSDKNVESVPLYLHSASESNPVKWSVGASLLPEKPNVASGEAIIVEQIDILRVLKPLGGKPIIKIDIEGAEVQLISRLLEDPKTWDAAGMFIERHSFVGDDILDSLIRKLRAIKGDDCPIFENWP